MGEHRATFPLVLSAALAAVSLGIAAGVWICPTILLLALLLHSVGGLTLTSRRRVFVQLLIAVPYALWLRNPPEQIAPAFIPTHALFVFGFLLLTIGIYHLLSYRDRGSAPMALGSIIFAFAMSGVAARHESFDGLMVIFVLLVLWQLRRGLALPLVQSSHWGDMARRGIGLLGVVAIAIAMQTMVVDNFPLVGRWLANQYIRAQVHSTVGFDQSNRLGSIQRIWRSEDNQRVMLRCWSDQSPEYLRGAVYEHYRSGLWITRTAVVPREPIDTFRGRHVFNLADRRTDTIAGTVYTDRTLADTFFLPHGTHQLSAFADEIIARRAFVVRHRRRGAVGGYGFYEPVADMAPPADMDLTVPSTLKPALAGIARHIVGDEQDPAAIVARIEQYFHDHYEYELSMALSGEKDPVIEFLQDKDAGYCEYFASAATLLLRSAGVPARYVTGFVCAERSVDGQYWIARQRDAHAWVEAYLPDDGWVIAEPTTSAARPQAAPVTLAARLGEWFGAQWHRLVHFVGYGGVLAVIATLWSWLTLLITEIIPVWAWGVVVAAVLMWWSRHQIQRWLTRWRRAPQSRHVRDLRRKLMRAQRLLRRHGLTLEPGATVGSLLMLTRSTDLPDPVRQETVDLLTAYQAGRFRRRS